MSLPGIGGPLFPGHFLATRFGSAAAHAEADRDLQRAHRRFLGWWQQVELTCGPATGLRGLFDLVAMPLAALLGFRARDASFLESSVQVRLTARSTNTSVSMVLLPWAHRASRRTRDSGVPDPAASWTLIVAPPFLSLIDTRGHAFRRSVEFRLPDALDSRSFRAFWSVCHASTLLTSSGLDLLNDAAKFQDMVRADLQAGVVTALTTLGPVLGRAATDALHRRFDEALTLVYRILFLLFAESRALASPARNATHARTYSVTALCRDASHGVSRHTGLWDGLAAITRLSRAGCDSADLVARPFNGRLFARSAAPQLESGSTARPTRLSRQRDDAIARTLVALGSRPGAGGREAISYADLGVEQLGAVYERVLDLDPDRLAAIAAEETVRNARSHSRRRKETGTFYTPQPLAEFVIRRTLAPLVTGASSDDLLTLRILDPAMGSGAFLVAACRYLADAYEHALVSEGRCAETDFDVDSRAGIRRLIASRCLAGVDANPVAVQLARLSLWLTTLARDKPLSFLDHQLRAGDSLIGAAPDDLWRLGGPGKGTRNETPLFEAAGLEAAFRGVARPWRILRERGDETVADVRERERVWSSIEGQTSPLAPWRRACDLWCARWFWPAESKVPSVQELRAAFDGLLHGDRAIAHDRLAEWVITARTVARERRFFHWPLEFADVFHDDEGAARRRPGFDAVIGNPPWEVLRGDGTRRDVVRFIRGSGLYPACDRGHLNLYQPFLERSLALARPGGRVGLILPWGVAADEGAASLRKQIFQRHRVGTILGLDNAAGMFPIHRGLRFMVLTVAAHASPRLVQARFGARTAAEIDGLPAAEDVPRTQSFPMTLDADLLRTAGGPSLRIPDVRTAEDLSWLVSVRQRFPQLGSRNGWNVSFGRELNATEDRREFGRAGLPVIDGKHIGPFRVDVASAPRRITEAAAARLLPSRPFSRARLAYRDVAGVGNRLTLIAAIIPAGIVTTHTLFCLRTQLADEQQAFLCGLFNSATLNRLVRMLMGSHVTTALIEELPMPVWKGSEDQLYLARLAAQIARSAAQGPPDAAELQHDLNERVAAMYR